MNEKLLNLLSTNFSKPNESNFKIFQLFDLFTLKDIFPISMSVEILF